MSVLRSMSTGVASCLLLAPVGCRRPPADLSVDPSDGSTAEAASKGASCEDGKPSRRRQQPAPGSSGDVEPPVIVGGTFIARDRIQLSFSEPLAAVDQVNPRQFRLSSAYSRVDYQAGYATGYYYDLNGNDSYMPPLVVIGLDTYEGRAEVLGLQLNSPIPIDRCIDIRETQRNLADEASGDGPIARSRIGVYLHYTSRGSVGIRDTANNPMTDMGGEWALHFGARSKNMNGTEPVMRLDLLLELDCPDESLGSSAPPGPI